MNGTEKFAVYENSPSFKHGISSVHGGLRMLGNFLSSGKNKFIQKNLWISDFVTMSLKKIPKMTCLTIVLCDRSSAAFPLDHADL